MSAYLVRRLAQSIVVVAVVGVLVFAMMFLSGDPAALLLPPDASREEIEAFRHEMGFDLPFWMQFVKFSGSLLVGVFGRSCRFQEPALSVVLKRRKSPTRRLPE